MVRGELAERTAQELISEGVPFVEATVVRAKSPTSARPGDAAIVRPDGIIEGFVGGACAETSVRLQALRALETGEPVLLRILPGEAAAEAADEEGAVTVQNPCFSGGALEIFIEPRLPAATLRVVGRTPIGLALADLGKRLGFAVELDSAERGDPQPGDAALVVASHGHEEERILTAALRDGVPYVGLVASRKRGEAVRDSLDLPEKLRATLHTPAGLEIDAESSGEIALAILAEIVALRRSGEPAVAEPEPKTVAVAATEVAIDPVCGMEVAISDASIHLDHDGERFYFCREGCRERFAAEHAPGAGVR